ncbi:DNA repair exonuclease SbcCD D subunit [Armadillidium vulgare iridescent virus]|uniref:DNA repair exonuclease SbcCD D subunit n=1 Tax=Armadillidium vulgare iridescent virus TaxID=72201 RepID=A0A068QL40_9VIRU|nr:DNA repair exonuclease SbcCD D subunit [Armadillidium vulgare iridescent virus]CCV02450.1 DNA repair exonuclease SbcCD D subunit [Armadillidium vulgare iridescent virus]
MKLLFIGDPHFQVGNLEIIDLFVEQCLTHLKNEEVDICVIAGDILHTHERLHTTALNKATAFIDSVRKICKTYVLVGNHDYENNQQFQSTKHWMNSLKEWSNVIIVDKSIISREYNINLAFVPYVPPGRFIEALETIDGDFETLMLDISFSTETKAKYKTNDEWKKADCIFAHQEFYGCKMGAIESTEGDKWDLNFPLVVSGHIHSEQKPQRNIFYPGSVIQHAFGESENNGLLLITFFSDFPVREKVFKKIILDIPRMKTIHVAIEKFQDMKIAPVPNERLKIICKGSNEEFKALKKTKQYKDAIDKGVKIHFKFIDKKIANYQYNNHMLKKFPEILEELLSKENNQIVTDLFREITQ